MAAEGNSTTNGKPSPPLPHFQANGATTPSDPSVPIYGTCPFLNIPAELRNRIYRLALVNEAPIKVGFESTKVETEESAPARSAKWQCRFTMVAPLTEVSRQLRQECLGIYIGENVFHFAPLDVRDVQDSRAMALFEVGKDSNLALISKRLNAFQAWCQASAALLKSVRIQLHDSELSCFRPAIDDPTRMDVSRGEIIYGDITFTAKQADTSIAIADLVTLPGTAPEFYCGHRVEELVSTCNKMLDLLMKISQICIDNSKDMGMKLCNKCRACGGEPHLLLEWHST